MRKTKATTMKVMKSTAMKKAMKSTTMKKVMNKSRAMKKTRARAKSIAMKVIATKKVTVTKVTAMKATATNKPFEPLAEEWIQIDSRNVPELWVHAWVEKAGPKGIALRYSVYVKQVRKDDQGGK